MEQHLKKQIKGLIYSSLSQVTRSFQGLPSRWRFIKWLKSFDLEGTNLPETTIIQTKLGFPIQVRPADWTGRALYISGEYEPIATKIIQELLEPESCFIDIGANIGYFTLLASQKIKKQGKIVAFEPNPPIKKELENNIALNKLTDVVIRTEAVCDKNGQITLFCGPQNHSGITSMRPLYEDSPHIEIPCIKLDDHFIQEKRVDFIKLDIEGAELSALLGMENILKKFEPTLLVELSTIYLKQLGHSTEQLIKYLESLNYQGKIILQNSLIPLEQIKELPEQSNVIFHHKNNTQAKATLDRIY